MPTPRSLSAARPIDLAFREIDALGAPATAIDRNDPVAVAEHRQLRLILDILESHGAIDPDLALPATFRSMAVAE